MAPIALLAALAWSLAGAAGARPARSLLLYCAAGARVPVQEIAAAYAREHGVALDIQYAGSGTLLGNLELSRRGDLYLAADAVHLRRAVEKGLALDILPVARQALVLVVAKGNPLRVGGIADLRRRDVRSSLPDPALASSGLALRDALTGIGAWTAVAANAAVFRSTVSEVANDVLIGSADAGVVWDPLLRLNPGLERIPAPELAAREEEIGIGVLASSREPALARHAARYLAAADRGLAVFARHGFRVVAGEPWADAP